MAQTLITIDGITLPVVTKAQADRAKADYRAEQRIQLGLDTGFTVGGCTPCILRVPEQAPVGFEVTRVEQYTRHHLGQVGDRRYIGYVVKAPPVWVARTKGGAHVAQSATSAAHALRNLRVKMIRAEA